MQRRGQAAAVQQGMVWVDVWRPWGAREAARTAGCNLHLAGGWEWQGGRAGCLFCCCSYHNMFVSPTVVAALLLSLRCTVWVNAQPVHARVCEVCGAAGRETVYSTHQACSSS